MEETPTGWRAPLAVPRFRAFWWSGALSWYGDFLTLPALIIVCYRLAGEVGVGLLFVFESAPLLALLPIGGLLGDRGDRRRRLASLDLVRAALAGLTIGGAEGHVLLAVLFGAGLSRAASALYDPGRRRLVPLLLPPELIAAGGSLLSVISESALIVAPGLGALLLLVVSPSVLIAIDGVTFLVAAGCLVLIGALPARWGPEAYTPKHPWPALRRGFGLLLFEPTTRLFAIQAALGAALASVIQVYFVPLSHYIFHVHTNQVGLMYILVGGSSVLASGAALRIPLVRRGSVITIGYLHLAVTAAVGLLFGPWVAAAALVVFAGTGALQEVWGLNRIQAKTPPEGIGQAMGAALWFMFLGRTLGALVAIWGSSHLTRTEFMLALTAGALVVCLLASVGGQLAWRRNPAEWPPGGPPIPL